MAQYLSQVIVYWPQPIINYILSAQVSYFNAQSLLQLFKNNNKLIINQKMSIDISSLQQIYQRSDLHALANQSEKNNFNIRKFREKSNIKDKRKSLYTKYTDTTTKHRINTEPIEDRMKCIKSSMSYTTNAFDRIMNKNQPDYEKRMAFVGSLKHNTSQKHSIISYSPDDKTDREERTDIETEKAEKFKQMFKKHHKGPINNKIVETWLNGILMQSTQFEVLDESLGNAALKKFEIDENSLLSRAIKPQNIPRIYQALFVHSIGFNNNIKELVSGNTEVLKNVWKVFSILLEYCAQGKFQTLIGVIQRQKAMKIEQLRQEVAKRQQIIERNDELNENKNIQIFKQIKNLKQQNINLTNEKDILFEDYQKTQQAFNQEVALRLKFENKINELFGVHRELAVKHQRLYEDYKKKIIQWNISNQKNTFLTQQNGEMKIQINDLITQKQRLLSSQKYNKELISALKEEKVKLNDEYNFVKHQYDQQRRLNKQFKRRITQLEIEVKNLSEIVGIKDKSWKETHAEYQLSLEENNRLYLVINEQRTQIQALLYEKKQFNNKILNLMAEASFEKKKKQEFSKLYSETDKKLNASVQKTKDLELQIKIASKRNQSVEEDLKVTYENIKLMHAKNSELQQELQYLRRFRDNLDSVIQEKENLVQKFRLENQKLQQENEQLKTNLNKSQTNLKITKAELNSQIDNLNHRVEKLKQERELIELGDNQKNRLITSQKLQLERINKLLHNTVLDLKNQKFERFNLKANYEQSLNIMQKKNTQEKEMGREISELKQMVLKTSQQRDRTNLALENQVIRRERVQYNLQEKSKQFNEYKKIQSSFIHPFIFEDVAENFRKIKEKLQNAQIVIKMKIEQLKDTHQKYKNQIVSLKKSNQEYFASFKKQKEKELFQKQSELQYQKEVNASMKNRLQKLETLAETYTKKIQQRTTSQKEKIYADLIQQKTKSIQQLAKKLNLETAKREQLTKQIIQKSQSYEKQIIQTKMKFKKEKEERDEKINDLNFELKHIQKQSEKLVNEIKQNEAKFEAKLKEKLTQYMESYKKTVIAEVKDQIHSEQLMEEKGNTQFNNTNANWSLLDEIQKKNPAIKKRNDMSRKMKITYNYYQHNQKKFKK